MTSVETVYTADGSEELVTGCAGGFVQNFHVVRVEGGCELRPVWNSRAEGDVRGVAELGDGS